MTQHDIEILKIVGWVALVVMVASLLYIGFYGAWVARAHKRSRHIKPSPGQVWAEFGMVFRVNMVSHVGTLYLEQIGGKRARWTESKYLWSVRMDSRSRWLKRGTEVSDER